MKYYLFDVIRIDDYLDKGPKLDQISRKMFLEQISNLFATEQKSPNRIIVLPHTMVTVKDYDTIKKLAQAYVKKGFEGIMLKDPKCNHQRRRHPGIVKAKTITTYDLRVIDVQEGKGKLKNTLGALVLQSANKKTVNVGSGMKDTQRSQFWKNKDSLIGKIVEISAQEVTKNSLRFPVFLRFRDDKEDPDAF